MVFHDRPVYQEEHAAQLIMARSLHSPHKGRIHLRRSVDPLFAFPLQSDGGPYIFGNYDACLCWQSGTAVPEGQCTEHESDQRSLRMRAASGECPKLMTLSAEVPLKRR